MGFMNSVFEGEKVKEFSESGVKNRRKLVRRLDQVGKSDKFYDERRPALPAGKRISRTGKVYWETRKNRSDGKNSRV